MESRKYSTYVEHPYYGRYPILSNVRPILLAEEEFVIIRKCTSGKSIKGTAIPANMIRQKQSGSYLIKYFFDEERICCDCNRPFIFFAQEQKRWHEELGININAAGKRCFECRKIHRNTKKNNKRYAELVANEKPTAEQMLEMAEICMQEVEAGRFHRKQLQTAKALIRRVSRLGQNKASPDMKLIENMEQRLRNILSGA
ncbi:hypothetical protein CSC94_08935 [Zhengella mangrovi]|uniref:Probable zinc-binding domain-containing protein n=1 Tax=Zhengella mangrovi TaxID=1982044 RepID=A0A2G1QQP7_9HYPH|nr:zinc-ribbon domain containing protein [Zhengella mangrovi]PHP67791.1 hypothetical protein CSC94_08935 [Zhengella mangrovi]